MGRKISIATLLTVPAGTEGEETLYAVAEAKLFHVESVRIQFPSGCDFALQIRLLVGIHQIAPTVGFYSADGGAVEDEIDYTAGSGSVIKVAYKNTGSSDLKALILLRGELL